MTQLIPQPVKRSLSRLREDIHSALDHWLHRRERNGNVSTLSFGSPVDFEDTGDEVIVEAELPGFDEKDVRIEVIGNRLILRGRKKLENEERGKDFLRIQRGLTEFTRVIPLPPGVDVERASCRYKNGLLRVVIPKAENARAKRIEVRAS